MIYSKELAQETVVFCSLNPHCYVGGTEAEAGWSPTTSCNIAPRGLPAPVQIVAGNPLAVHSVHPYSLHPCLRIFKTQTCSEEERAKDNDDQLHVAITWYLSELRSIM